MSYYDHWMSVVCRASSVRHQQLLQRTSSPKLLAGFLPNLAGLILIWPSSIIVQMVLTVILYRCSTGELHFPLTTLVNVAHYGKKNVQTVLNIRLQYLLFFMETGKYTSCLSKRPRQTVQTQIRLLLKKQSAQGLPCLLFCQVFCEFQSR